MLKKSVTKRSLGKKINWDQTRSSKWEQTKSYVYVDAHSIMNSKLLTSKERKPQMTSYMSTFLLVTN